MNIKRDIYIDRDTNRKIEGDNRQRDRGKQRDKYRERQGGSNREMERQRERDIQRVLIIEPFPLLDSKYFFYQFLDTIS